MYWLFFLLLFNVAVVFHNFSLLVLCSFQSLLAQTVNALCFMTTLHVSTDYKETSGKFLHSLAGEHAVQMH